jgi:hypothetical protein
MQAAGDTAKPIWCTETGVAAESNVAETPPHSKGQLLLTEEPAMFADEVNTLLDSNQADPAQNNIPNFRRIYWFRLTEYDTYGILDKAGQPKLIYTSYQKEAKSGALDHLARVEDGGFEAKPSAPSAAGTPWTFDGACTVVRITPTVPPSAADAPEGFQVASLAGATASAAQSLYFPAGNYVINFQAAMVAGHPVNPIQVSVDGANVGAPLPPAGTAFGQMTSAPFTNATAGPHTIKLAGTADPAETYLDDVQVAPVP